MLNKKFKVYPNTIVPPDKGIDQFLEDNGLSILKPWLDKYPYVELVFNVPGGQLEISLELNQIITMTNDLHIQELIPNGYVIGNDAGDIIYLYITDMNKPGVYEIDDDLSLDSLSFVANSLDEWLS